METHIIFMGFSFRRYPNAKRKSDQRYFKGWYIFNGKKEKGYLHRFKWMINYGEIPKGFHVHHKDLNYFNNDIDNFELKSPQSHRKLHAELWTDEYKSSLKKNLDQNRHLANDWHRSEDGIKQKKANYHFLLLEQNVKKKCLNCSIEFETNRPNQKHCSSSCRIKKASLDKYYRDKASGKYIPLHLRSTHSLIIK